MAIPAQHRHRLTQDEWLDHNLVRTRDGYIAYKTFGAYHVPPEEWLPIEVGKTIKAAVHPDINAECASGVNVSTWEWQKRKLREENAWDAYNIYEMLIPYDAEIVVPIKTDGKFRCDKAIIVRVALYARRTIFIPTCPSAWYDDSSGSTTNTSTYSFW